MRILSFNELKEMHLEHWVADPHFDYVANLFVEFWELEAKISSSQVDEKLLKLRSDQILAELHDYAKPLKIAARKAARRIQKEAK